MASDQASRGPAHARATPLRRPDPVERGAMVAALCSPWAVRSQYHIKVRVLAELPRLVQPAPHSTG